MNLAHVHLLLNHLPIVGIPLAILLLGYAIAAKSKDVLIAALGATALIGLLSIPTFLTGEPAEDVVENRPGMVKDWIEQHEEAAEAGLVAALVMGGIGAGALILVLKKGALSKPILTVVVISQVIASGLLARAGNLGGKISHPEIRDGWLAPPAGENPGSSPERDHDD